MTRPDRLSADVVDHWVTMHDEWSVADSHLVGRFSLAYERSIDVLVAVRDTIKQMDHHPRVVVEYGQLTVELWTHDRGGVTQLDLSLAERFHDEVLRTRAT